MRAVVQRVSSARVRIAPASLPASLQFSGQALDSQPILFTSTKPVTVSALDLRAVQRRDANGYQNLTVPDVLDLAIRGPRFARVRRPR